MGRMAEGFRTDGMLEIGLVWEGMNNSENKNKKRRRGVVCLVEGFDG
jgi:hypothetical protein